MNAILVVIMIGSAGNSPVPYLFYPFSTMQACEQAIHSSWVRQVNPDDGRGVQAMYCIEAPKERTP